MKDLNDIIRLSEKYEDAFQQQRERYAAWNHGGHKIVKDTLDRIAKEIIDNNDYFKSNLYVTADSPIGSVTINSGKMPIPNSDNFEEGFLIGFALLANAKILVYAYEHHESDKNPTSHRIQVIDDPNLITEGLVTDLVFKGLEKVYKSSTLFIGN